MSPAGFWAGAVESLAVLPRWQPQLWIPPAQSKLRVLLLLEGETKMRRYASMWFIVAIVVTGLADVATAQRPPEGQLVLGLSFTIAPTYLYPFEATQVIASFSLRAP
jgi:hypothetical protein